MKIRQVLIILGVFILGGVVGFWIRHSVPTMFDPEVIAAAQSENEIAEWTKFMIGEWVVECPKPSRMCVAGTSMTFNDSGTVVAKDENGVLIEDEVISAIPWKIDWADDDVATLKYMFIGPSSAPFVTLKRLSENEVVFEYINLVGTLNLVRSTHN